MWALNRIKTPDGKIHIPGFYDKVHVPTPAQESLLAQMPDDTERDRLACGLSGYVNGMQGLDVLRASSFAPTANILGIEAGYNGPGTKTVLPNTAHAKLDLRLVPDQEPEEIFQALTAFLKDEGFHNIEVKRIDNEGDLLPGISDPELSFVQTVLRALREANSQEPCYHPFIRWVGSRWRVCLAATRWSRPADRGHRHRLP